MIHPELAARMVRMLSPTELNLKKRRRLVKLISEYVPEDRLLRILDGNYKGPPLTEGDLRGGTGVVKELGQSVPPSGPPPCPRGAKNGGE